MMSLAIPICFAVLAATGINIGKVFQKEAACRLPTLRLQRDVLCQYVKCTDWLMGLACDIGGTLFMVVALSLAPVSVIEPVAGSGLAILALFCHYYLHERLSCKQWIGIGFAMSGVIGMGVIAAPSNNPMSTGAILPLLACLMGVQVALEMCYLKTKRDELVEVASGYQAGMLFGLSAATTRLGQVMAQQTGIIYCFGGGIACSFLLSPVGFFFQTRGFKRGRAVIVVTFTSLSSISTGLLVGLTVLNEPIPQSSTTFAAWCASIGLIVTSALLLMEGSATVARTSQVMPRTSEVLIQQLSFVSSFSHPPASSPGLGTEDLQLSSWSSDHVPASSPGPGTEASS